MKVGILGSGDVGKHLAVGFANLGHQVKIASRDFENEKLLEWAKSSENTIDIGSFEDTADFGEIIVLATKWDGTENAIHLANPENLSHKIVIDVTNPLDFTHGMPPKLYIGHTNSGGETVQRLLPKSHVVKTLNIVNSQKMVDPIYKEGTPAMLLCGNDDKAKQKVTEILHDFGWSNVTDLGDITESRIMEPLTILWVTYGLKHNTWTHAFTFLHQ
jgi:8-hydroxy-5-deazaflavin:NADPH oxidoreductase